MSNCESGTCDVNTNATGQSTECCDMPSKLLGLADEAWHELVKEKIKANIEECCGEKLDELAKLVAEANAYKWKHVIEGKKKCDEYQSQVKAFFTSCTSEEDSCNAK